MIDSHAHLTSEDVLPHVDEVVERALKAGIEAMVCICTDEASLLAGLDLQKRRSEILLTAATPPHDVEREGESFFPIVEKAAPSLIAIGETGLDYYYEHSPKELQHHFLGCYFELASRVNLPIVYHCRGAFKDLFGIADEQYKGKPAVVHCFTGTKEEAKGCLDRGWLISLSGIVTYKNSEALREVAAYVPLNQLLIETDTPYLAPQSRRGRPNEPSYLPETAAKIAKVKGIDVSELSQATVNNAVQFFNLKT
jgi:TatD DNase family protein